MRWRNLPAAAASIFYPEREWKWDDSVEVGPGLKFLGISGKVAESQNAPCAAFGSSEGGEVHDWKWQSLQLKFSPTSEVIQIIKL